jgi:hypothetical protein
MTLKELSQLYYLNREIEMNQERLAKLDYEIKADEEQLQYLELKAASPSSPSYDGMPKSPSYENRLESTVARIIELQEHIKRKKALRSDCAMMIQPWLTGATDDVPGNDGSPYNNTSGKEPFKLQGIEVMLGTYEVAADITLYEDAVNGYTVYANRKAAEIASGNAGTNPVTLGTIPKEETAAWKYNAELNWDENS